MPNISVKRGDYKYGKENDSKESSNHSSERERQLRIRWEQIFEGGKKIMKKMVTIMMSIIVMASIVGCGKSVDKNISTESRDNTQQVTDAASNENSETGQNTSNKIEQTYDNDSATPVEHLSYSIDEDGVNILGLSNEFVGTELIIPYTIEEKPVVRINYKAFEDCTELEKVVMPNTINKIDGDTFIRCTNLKTVVLSENLTTIPLNMFFECSNLTDVYIPNGIEYIATKAFFRCNSLTDVELPESLAAIGVSAFSDCTSLTNINLPSSLTTIEDRAFSGCNSLQKIELPESVTEIPMGMFMDCSSLSVVTIPDSVTSIGKFAFLNTPWGEINGSSGENR